MTGSFLPTLRSVAPKAAQMIEDSLYHDLLRRGIAFDEAEGLVCRILALNDIHAHLRKMVNLGDIESTETLVEVDKLLNKLVRIFVRVDPQGALGLELFYRKRMVS